MPKGATVVLPLKGKPGKAVARTGVELERRPRALDPLAFKMAA